MVRWWANCVFVTIGIHVASQTLRRAFANPVVAAALVVAKDQVCSERAALFWVALLTLCVFKFLPARVLLFGSGGVIKGVVTRRLRTRGLLREVWLLPFQAFHR